jgi:formylglycine-generating enzyme required for sulfatase activity
MKKISNYIKLGYLVTLLFATPYAHLHADSDKNIENSLGMKFVLIPAGKFMMGSREAPHQVVRKGGGKVEDFQREHPLHQVKITKSFYMQTTEVTIKQFSEFVRATEYLTSAQFYGYSWVWRKAWLKVEGASWHQPLGPGDSTYITNSHPVVQVNWYDTMAFCKWLSEKEGKIYRLPTEAEWEYVCRAGTNTPFSYGKTISSDQANFEGTYVYGDSPKGIYREIILPVGSFSPNAWGVFDMHGNVWEWCSDFFGVDYYKISPTQDPPGPNSGDFRVIRGGSWYNYARILRSALRFGKDPSNQDSNLGFRVVREN